MQYIVMDLEWNQSPKGRPMQDRGLTFEIIEIGALKLNEKMEIIGEFQELVKPQLYPKIHEIIQEMVRIAPEELAAARTFPEVVKDFFAWCGDDFRFCTWGTMDLPELQKNMDFYGVENSFPIPLYYYDIQKLFSICFDDGKSRVSLETAVEQLELEKKTKFHRAKADCYYTALILELLDWKKAGRLVSVDYNRLPAAREEEIYLVFPDYSKYVSREFDSKEEALQDKRVASATCYLCRKALRKKIKWFSPNGKNYYCLAQCPEHGFLQGKIRMKKSDSGKTFAVKTLKLIPAERAALLRVKQQEVREKRKIKNQERRQRQKNENEE